MERCPDDGMEKMKAVYDCFFPLIYNYLFYRTLNHRQTEILTGLVFEKILSCPAWYTDTPENLERAFYAEADRQIRQMPPRAEQALTKQSPLVEILQQLTEHERLLVHDVCYRGQGTARHLTNWEAALLDDIRSRMEQAAGV